MLILVVIGIKLAYVDTALKGKETTSHLLFNLSLVKSTFFSDFRRSVSLLLFLLCCCLEVLARVAACCAKSHAHV